MSKETKNDRIQRDLGALITSVAELKAQIIRHEQRIQELFHIMRANGFKRNRWKPYAAGGACIWAFIVSLKLMGFEPIDIVQLVQALVP